MKRNLAIILGFSFLSTLVNAETPATQATTGTNTSSVTSTATSTADLAAQNLRAGQAFLSTNKNMPGVVTTADGLEYKVLQAGHGPKPTKNDVVTVDYEGRHLNGQVFDSSYQRGQPATFPLSMVIPGWTQALTMMNTGATWEIYIPAKLAYGKKGAQGAIGPNEALIFKVHLISIKPAG